MSYAEWKAKRAEEIAVFEAFFRKAPFKGRYTIFGGLDEVKRFLRDFKFSEQHLTYLRKILPSADPAFFDWLAQMDCSQVTVTGIPDG
jgi:nicotinate phosphoribosyltransferase